MARRITSPVFVGRRRELDRLGSALSDAVAGRPSVVLLAGDAGVGKTRLVAEFSALATASGARVLAGGCLPVGEAGLPFAAVVEVLRGLVRTVGRPAFESLAGRGRADLARLVPDLGPVAPAAVESATDPWAQARIFELLLGLLGRLADESPVVCVIEDLHWADEATRTLVAYVVHNLAAERLLLLTTYRSDDLHRRHPLMPLLAELRRAPNVDRFELSPFSREELAEQLAAILGHDPEPSLLAGIEARSEGNAYLAEELVAVGHATRLPDTIEDVLLARVERLSEPAKELLRVASAAGHRVDAGLLAMVAAGVLANPMSAIREVVDERVLVRVDAAATGDRYTFRHALLQEAVYGQLLPSERVRYHESFARGLSELPGPLDALTAAELAHHWEAAGDLPRALEASVEAGRLAAGMYAFADAQRLFERGTALWDRVPNAEGLAGLDQAALLELAGTAAAGAGAYARAVDDLRSARDLVRDNDDPVRAGLLLERIGRYAITAGQTEQGLAASREAVALVPAQPATSARARVLAGLARSLFYMGLVAEVPAVAREAAEIARTTGTPDVEADALLALAIARIEVGSIGELRGAHDVMASVRLARDTAIDLGDDFAVLRAWHNLLAILDLFAREAACATEAARAVAWARERGRTRSGAGILVVAAFALWQLGRWREAADILGPVRSTMPEGRDLLILHNVLWELEFGRGEIDEAARRLDAIRECGLGRPDARYLPVLIGDFEARLALARGDLGEGRALVGPALTVLPTIYRSDANLGCYALHTGIRLEVELAERARARGAAADLREAMDRGRAIVDQARSLTTWIAAGVPELARRPRAIEALCEAEWSRLQRRPDARVWAAAAEACAEADQLQLRPYAQYRQAEAMLAAKADRSEVAGVLSDALAGVVAMGARPMQHDIESLAERARISLGPEASPSAGRTTGAKGGDRFGLSPREIEVLSLVAQGRTNRQIAAELFITEKTAGVHVSHILDKLGASGRTEAAAIAHRLRLVD